ncbi:hypothetical protein [Halobacteriovorax sp. ZH2_bin.1]|uniref:hypothetical protein n=1 Tax=unclassified Halobacteriovorax TaxID=2639665 RepID=UPI003719C901
MDKLTPDLNEKLNEILKASDDGMSYSVEVAKKLDWDHWDICHHCNRFDKFKVATPFLFGKCLSCNPSKSDQSHSVLSDLIKATINLSEKNKEGVVLVTSGSDTLEVTTKKQ